jgi:hypothetical protein
VDVLHGCVVGVSLPGDALEDGKGFLAIERSSSASRKERARRLSPLFERHFEHLTVLLLHRDKPLEVRPFSEDVHEATARKLRPVEGEQFRDAQARP